FLLTDGGYTQLDDPLQVGANTNAIGLWGDTAVGEYYGGDSNSYGFIERDGIFTTIDFAPGKPAYTAIGGIWGNTIVGGFLDEAGMSHGFVAEVPEPVSISLCAFGIFLLAGIR